MIYRFNDFELDAGRRELRLRGNPVEIQPKVYDLLLHLVQNADKVLSKDDLLEALWPGVVVADGVLHRAVSLARAALREGGAELAIKTHARKGYRFVESVTVDDTENQSRGDGLNRAYELCEKNRWADAVAAFAQADAAVPLGPRDLEQWAYAAQCAARSDEAIQPLERAVSAYTGSGDRLAAARAAITLAHIQFEHRETAVAKGWHKRAATLLEGLPESREHGLNEWLASRFAATDGDLEAAEAHGESACEIGRRLNDPEVEALGLLYKGLAVLAAGDLARGIECQDEAAAAALSGSVRPLIGGMVYCGVIWGCRNRADWQRAAQWSEQFTRWCARSGISAFPGVCRLHRAEVYSVRGELDHAEYELENARKDLPRAAPWAEGDAWRVLGDVRYMRGDLEGAEQAFRKAHELGWDPQPGYALVLLDQGKAAAAVRALERALSDKAWPNRQRRALLLTHLAIVAARAGDPARARSVLATLAAEAGLCATPALKAFAAQARAELAAAEGNFPEAVHEFNAAIRHWSEVGSPLNIASLRMRLAQVLHESGDDAAADLELSAAEAAFDRSGAKTNSAKCAEIRVILG